MSYPVKYRQEAFLIYTSLRNYERTRDQMRSKFERCNRLSKNTVMTWAREDDWEARINEIDERARELANEKALGERLEHIQDVRDVYKVVRNHILTHKNLKFKSNEGAINAFMSLSRRLDELTGHAQLNLREMKQVALVLINVLVKDDEIGKLVMKKQNYLLQQFEDEMRNEHLN